MTSQEEEDEEEKEEVRKHLPLSAGDDVTVECVAYNDMGQSRTIFNSRQVKSLGINMLGY